jgi:hypothetical protein
VRCQSWSELEHAHATTSLIWRCSHRCRSVETRVRRTRSILSCLPNTRAHLVESLATCAKRPPRRSCPKQRPWRCFVESDPGVCDRTRRQVQYMINPKIRGISSAWRLRGAHEAQSAWTQSQANNDAHLRSDVKIIDDLAQKPRELSWLRTWVWQAHARGTAAVLTRLGGKPTRQLDCDRAFSPPSQRETGANACHFRARHRDSSAHLYREIPLLTKQSGCEDARPKVPDLAVITVESIPHHRGGVRVRTSHHRRPSRPLPYTAQLTAHATQLSRSHIARHDAPSRPYSQALAGQASSAPPVPARVIISLLSRLGGMVLCDGAYRGRCTPAAIEHLSSVRDQAY